MRRIPLLGVALLLLTQTAGTAAAYDSQHTHRWITRQAIARLVEQYPGRYDELLEYADEVAAGAEEEDNMLLDGDSDPTTLRVQRHFFRPTDGKGLFMRGTQFPSSYEWAAVPNDMNEWDWGDGLRRYRQGDLAAAYRTLGHIVHLIEDSTVPAHSHLDIHGPPAGDDYEGYCSSQTTDEYTSALPLPPEGALLPVFTDPYDAWVATAMASYHRNFYPGNLTDPEGGASGVIKQMFPDLVFHWFWEEWRIPDVGSLGSDFFEEEPGWYYFKNAEHPAASDKVTFDPSSPWADTYAANPQGAPMVELFARDLIPIAILHSAGVMKLFLDEAYAQEPEPPAMDDPPSTGEDPGTTPACAVSHSPSRGASVLALAFVIVPLLRRRRRAASGQ